MPIRRRVFDGPASADTLKYQVVLTLSSHDCAKSKRFRRIFRVPSPDGRIRGNLPMYPGGWFLVSRYAAPDAFEVIAVFVGRTHHRCPPSRNGIRGFVVGVR